MTGFRVGRNSRRRGRRAPGVYRKLILLIVCISVLPTVVLLVISYFQAIAYTRTNLESIVKKATEETDKLLKDADTILHRSNVDLQNADSKTSVNILQRQIYTDFRFREAGIITSEGYLTLSSLGIIDPPIPISFSPKAGFNPNEPDLQVLGSGRSQVMREESIALALKGDENIGGLYLLVDPVVLTYFLEAIPNLDLGPDGYIAFMTSNDRLLSSIGASPQNIFASLQNPSSHALRSIRTTDDKKITIVGEVRRQWALRYWLRELSISAPLTVIISGLLSYFFIRQVHQSNSLDYELKLGLAQNEFEIHYQPIIDLETRRCIGSEALLRWRHPQRGLIYPGLFIPIAEQTGFILSLTEWLIQKVIQDQTVLQTRFPDLYTSVNLSPTQLNTGNIERLVQTLNTAVEQPEQFSEQSNVRITFEITENKIVEAQEQVVQDSIARLKLWGTRFAIDDFGTGYSNISYLQRLDVDQLKLDQLFIRGLERDTNTAQLVDSLIDFGNRMGLTLIAEGIETENQYEYLRARGVQYGQGWLFSRALPLEEFERFLDSQNT